MFVASTFGWFAALPPNVAFACATGRTSVPFNGFHLTGGQNHSAGSDRKTQARATIPYYSPFVDFGYDSIDAQSSAWPMIADSYDCGGYGLVQVGEREVQPWPYSRTFVESEKCFANPPNGGYVLPSVGPQTHAYIVNHASDNSGNWSLYVDVTLVAAGTDTTWAPVYSEYFGETHLRGDQVMGGYNSHYSFTSLQECSWNSSRGTFCYAPPLDEVHGQFGLGNNNDVWTWMHNSLPYNGRGVVTSSFGIWDGSCAT